MVPFCTRCDLVELLQPVHSTHNVSNGKNKKPFQTETKWEGGGHAHMMMRHQYRDIPHAHSHIAGASEHNLRVRTKEKRDHGIDEISAQGDGFDEKGIY